jgi:spore coat protein U-like protein
MFTKKQTGIVLAALASLSMCGAAMAANADSTLTVSATLTTACEVSPTASISFGSFAALASTGDMTANSGSTFQVACSNSATPTIYATGTRSMVNGGTNLLPFNLSLTSGAASDDLPSDSGTASTFTLTQDGSLHDVVLYAKTAAADFKGLPSGPYTTDITVSVVY